MSRDQILALVDSYTILAHYLAPYHKEPRLIQGHNISNPLLSEKQATPSFNIFCDQKGGHEWKFKDFATGDHGSCFDLVMKLFNLNFIEAKSKICQDFNLISEAKNHTTTTSPNPAAPNSPEFSVVQRDFTKQELDYWLKYGITSEILNRFNVKALSKFSTMNKKGTAYSKRSDHNHFIFTYDHGNWHKLYKPLDDKKFRFQFLGPKPQNFVFGFDQLPEKGTYVFLTGGEKDVMSLAAHGFAAISLNSETAKPTPELLANLRSRFDEVVILYDNDKTGIEQS
ncbi:MAG TPA: toprim domain-containing protein, partial [Catalimonadaceae bacterium]|nr:toprim domain-containing protein [Catalimonadaceae bacterium]